MRLSVKLSMKLSKMDGIHYKHPVIAIILLLFCSILLLIGLTRISIIISLHF